MRAQNKTDSKRRYKTGSKHEFNSLSLVLGSGAADRHYKFPRGGQG